MNWSKSKSNEIISLEEGELLKPLTSANLEVIPSVRSHSGSLLEMVNRDIDSRSETDDLQPIEKPSSLGFSSGDIDDNNPPEHRISLSRPNGRDIFPSQQDVVATPDVNVYQHKKTLAQGMMDLALVSANANQMRYVLQTDGKHPYFYPSLIMIGMSLFLQIAVGIGLIWNSRYNVKEHEQMCKANKANNWTVIGIFLVTILNVFISSFSVNDQI